MAHLANPGLSNPGRPGRYSVGGPHRPGLCGFQCNLGVSALNVYTSTGNNRSRFGSAATELCPKRCSLANGRWVRTLKVLVGGEAPPGPGFLASFATAVCSLVLDVHRNKQMYIRVSGWRVRTEKVMSRERSVGPNAQGGGWRVMGGGPSPVRFQAQQEALQCALKVYTSPGTNKNHLGDVANE